MGEEKLHEYQGFVGRLHSLRDSISQSWAPYKERWAESGGGIEGLQKFILNRPHPPTANDFSHIYRYDKKLDAQNSVGQKAF
jgi:solute carrier family 45, member 1/2/4